MRRIIVELEERKGTETAEAMAESLKRLLVCLGYHSVSVYAETGHGNQNMREPEQGSHREIELMPFMMDKRRCADGR